MRDTVQETLNALLDEEAGELAKAARYELNVASSEDAQVSGEGSGVYAA